MYERPQGIENSRIWIDGCFDFTHHGTFLLNLANKISH